MPLPPTRAAASAAAALSVLDYRSAYAITDPADAGGILTVEFDAVPPGVLWLLQRITILCTSETETRAMVYAGPPSQQNFVDGTESGNIDTADETSPILIESATTLTIQWTGASPGAVGTARIQYQIVQRN